MTLTNTVTTNYLGAASVTNLGTATAAILQFTIPQGIPGTNGVNGTNGLDGATGATGPQGPIGLTGATGPQGVQGIQGVAGINGTNGLAGVNGTNGLDGVAATVTLTNTVTTNYLGAAGVTNLGTATAAIFQFTIPQGIPGTNGLNGINGTNGLNGVNGTNGLNGINGTNGINGLNGVAATVTLTNTVTTNYLGAAGVTNLGTATAAIFQFTIPQGIPGTNGLNGINGTNGLNGVNGTNGLNGINGTNGINGAPGPAGPLVPNLAYVTTNQTFTASNTFTGVLIATNATNVIYGTFTGNGGGLTNLSVSGSQITGTIPLAQLPASVVTNGASGVNISGTFTGNGAGLTGIAAAATPPVGMVLIPAGTFSMGDSLDGESDATPTTNITVSAIYMDVNLVSYSQWKSVYYWATNQGGYGFANAGAGKAANNPVQTVDWFDCVKWCNARSQQAGRTPVYYTDAGYTHIYTNLESYTVYVNPSANGYRLPTEAEWEKAARGGLSGQRFPWGNNIDENLANYSGATASYTYDLGPNGYNAVGSVGGTSPATSPVGSFAPNGYGLNDMAGNVYEWCGDWYGTPYGQPSNTNPTGPTTGSLRVLRGGGWGYNAFLARCANRSNHVPNGDDGFIGFRCVRGL